MSSLEPTTWWVCTHSGVPFGMFFSKKLGFSVPLGNLIRVTGRPARWGRITGAIAW